MLLRLFRLVSILYLRLAGARRMRLNAGPVSLVYYRLGPPDGEPWVLLHGLGSVAVSWDLVLRKLRRGCRLLVPELSSLGGTKCPGDGLSVEKGAEVVAQLIEKEFGGGAGGGVNIAGLSLGGWMAVRLALERPELVARLALIDAAGYRDQDWDTIQSLVEIEDLSGVDRLYKALFARTPWIMKKSRRAFLRAYTSPGVKSILSELSERDTYDDTDLSGIRVPVALIWGDRDGLFPLATAHRMAAALPDARLFVLPSCGHACHIEHPRQLLEAIQELRRDTSPAIQGGGHPGRALHADTA